MDRAGSDRVTSERHFALARTRAMPGRAALVVALLIAMVPLALILLRAPSWATSQLHQRSRSAQPIRLRTLFVVNTTLDEVNPFDGLCSLREAIMTTNAAGGIINDCGQGTGFDEIMFNVPFGTGTITVGNALVAFPAIANNLIIDGTGQTITVDRQSLFQVVAVNSGATLALNSLTIQNGSITGDGGAIGNSGTLSVTNSTISSSTSTNFGGGIANGINNTLTVSDSTVSGNMANDGGGISNRGTLTVTNSTISGNTAANATGAGIFNDRSLPLPPSPTPTTTTPPPPTMPPPPPPP